MKRKLYSLYSRVVNWNQWFTYGRNWWNIPLNILAFSSYVSILLMFFGVEKSALLLVLLTSTIIASLFAVGFILFSTGAEMIDKTMLAWHNPLTEMVIVGLWWQVASLAIENNIPFPEEFKSWGLEGWGDFHTICRYVLHKGEQAKAKPIVRSFFERSKT